MKAYRINNKKISQLEICALLVIGLLIILNTPLNLSAPAINNDDSDTASIQINTNLDPHGHSAQGQVIFVIPGTEKAEITPLSTTLNPLSRSAVYNDLIPNIQLRAPPTKTGLFV